jgi:hypothetical protein
MATEPMELVIVGNGARSCLLAFLLMGAQANLRLHLVHLNDHFPDGPGIPFFSSLVPRPMKEILEPLLSAEWPGYRVILPTFDREVSGTVAMLSPAHLSLELLGAAERIDIQLARPAEFRSIDALLHEVKCAHPSAGILLCFDERHSDLELRRSEVVHELSLHSPHGLDLPILCDASGHWCGVDFLQYLPIGPNMLQIRFIGIGRAIDPEATSTILGRSSKGRLLRTAGRQGPALTLGGSNCPPAAAQFGSPRDHPILASPVHGIAQLAALFLRDLADFTPDQLRARLAVVIAQWEEERSGWRTIADDLSRAAGPQKPKLLERLFGTGRHALQKCDTGNLLATDWELINFSCDIRSAEEIGPA